MKFNRKKRKPQRVLTPLAPLEREMFVSVDQGETRIAFREQGRLAEYYFERNQETSIVGNIYKGRVVSVLPGLQAAFVDIGLERSGFLHVRDLLTDSLTIEDYMVAKQARKHEEDLPEGNEEEGRRESDARGRPKIQDLLSKGKEILVQVEKESISTKGPRLTGQISLPARLLVLIPRAEHAGVSHRIADERERERLKKILARITPKGFGAIARTSAVGASEDELKADLAYLIRAWKNLNTKARRAKAPAVLHAEDSLLHRVARDVLTRDDRRIILEATAEGKRMRAWLASFLAGWKPEIVLYQGAVPMFEALNLEAELDRALQPKVWLKCGGTLVIEETEALVVVDVNTGRNIGKKRQDETILRTNLEAAQEIARQLRLRDLGGIIVLDFIDMRIEEHKERVYLELAQALQRDRAKTSIRQLTDLGLIEMTRKRVRGSLLRTLYEACPMCQSLGWVRSRETTALRLARLLERARRLTGEDSFSLELSPLSLEHLRAAELRAQAHRTGVKLTVAARSELPPGELRLKSPATGVLLAGETSG